MTYKVEYGMKTPAMCTVEKAQKKQKNNNVKKWIVYCLIFVLIAVCVSSDILIPGDARLTKAAMSNFVSDIRDGEQVVDAFAAFCQTVLQVS